MSLATADRGALHHGAETHGAGSHGADRAHKGLGNPVLGMLL